MGYDGESAGGGWAGRIQRDTPSNTAGVAGVADREALLELASLGLLDTLLVPPPGRVRGAGGLLSDGVGGAVDEDEEEDEEEDGVPSGMLCRPWPHT